jgi:hypothetical protein
LLRIDKNSSLEPNEDAPLIVQGFEKMASGLYSADEVRRWLNGQGLKLSKNTFPNIIRNIVYTGKIPVKAFKNEPSQVVIGLHPPLVSDEIFSEATLLRVICVVKYITCHSLPEKVKVDMGYTIITSVV